MLFSFLIASAPKLFFGRAWLERYSWIQLRGRKESEKEFMWRWRGYMFVFIFKGTSPAPRPLPCTPTPITPTWTQATTSATNSYPARYDNHLPSGYHLWWYLPSKYSPEMPPMLKSIMLISTILIYMDPIVTKPPPDCRKL